MCGRDWLAAFIRIEGPPLWFLLNMFYNAVTSVMKICFMQGHVCSQLRTSQTGISVSSEWVSEVADLTCMIAPFFKG